MALTPQQVLMYGPIRHQIERLMPFFKGLLSDEFPAAQKLNLAFRLINSNQKPLSFIDQDMSLPFPDLSYEERIFHKGIIATRKDHWHDFFNAVVWHAFPQTKSVINGLHVQELKTQKSTVRSRKRDLLTLFDESGVIVIAEDSILELIKQHKWNTLFIEKKQEWLDGKITLLTFGHALYEKYLNPYIGMTAQTLLLNSQVDNIDSFLARKLKKGNLLQSKSELSPLPLLGVPGWHKNQDEAFYANKLYFR